MTTMLDELLALLAERVQRGHTTWPLGQGSVDDTPWPGASMGAPNVPPPVSGRTPLQLAAGTTPRPTSFQNVCTWRSDKGPYPLSLIVNIDSKVAASVAAPYAGESQLHTQVSGQAMGTTSQPAGVLRLTYGLGNGVRTLEADLRSGTYQLPPCDYASVDAFAYLLGPLGVFDVAAALVPGMTQDPARLVATWKPTIAAAGSVTEVVPYGARWVSLAGGAATGIGAGNPRLRLAQADGGVVILQDYELGNLVGQPGQPVELSSRSPVTVYNDGGVAALVSVKFYLET